jgi:hypothetical protein
MQRMKDLGCIVVAAAATVLALAPPAAAEDLLKVAVAQRGAWETAAPHLGQQAGIFKKHGIVLDLTYADDDPEVPVTSGNADVAVGVGIMDVLRAYTGKDPSLRIIGANMTGSANYWYVAATSPIKKVKDISLPGSVNDAPGWGSLISRSQGSWTSVCEGREVPQPLRDAKSTHNCHCASACFLIWAAGVQRSGDVLGLHRPTIEATAFAKLPPDRAGVLYRQLLSEIDRYLAEMEIPRQFIEIMTNTSSKEIRWLTYEETDSIGDMPVSIAEWIASNCGAMTKSEKDTMSKISADISFPKNVSRQDRMLQERLKTKQIQIRDCTWDKIEMARDAIKEVSD